MMKLLLILAFAVSATSAMAKPIEIIFTGKVQNSPTDKIILQQPDGSSAPYQGSNAPTYPVKSGDLFKVAFYADADVSNLNPQQKIAEGVYRFPVRSSSSAGFGDATVNSIDVGQFGQVQAPGGGSDFYFNGLDLIYDSNAGTFSLDFSPDGLHFNAAPLPGYSFDPVADLFTPASCGNDPQACPRVKGIATQDSLTFSGLPVYSTDGDQIGDLDDLRVSGSFNLPTYQVPAPPVAALLILALGIIAARTRRARKVESPSTMIGSYPAHAPRRGEWAGAFA